MQHLLRRAGFSPSESEVQHALSLGPDAILDELLNPDQTPDNLDPQLQTLDTSSEVKPPALVGWWLARISATGRPSLEKMTLFWHGWHTSGFDKVGPKNSDLLYTQNEFQRQNAYSKFPDILKGISRQPAMMLYLDTATNVKGHPNENYSRELMELFSMGVGNYSETDVQEGARAFTGYSLNRQTRGYVFRPALHDSSSKTFLGQTGNFSGDDVVDIIMRQPATADFVASKIWRSFAYPNPDKATLAPISAKFRDSSGDMRAVMRAVFTHPQFYNGPSYRALVKSPVEYTVGGARQFGLQVPALGLAGLSQQIGQVPFLPPNVAGWPGGPSWMSSGAFLARANGVAYLLFGAPGGANQAGKYTGLDAGQYVDSNQIATAGDLVDHLLALLVDGRVANSTRSTLVDFASGGRDESTSLASLPAAQRELHVRGTAYLIMAGPEYHLA